MRKSSDKEHIYLHTHNFRLSNRENPSIWLVKYYTQDAEGIWSATESVNITLVWSDFPDIQKSTRVSSPQDIIYELGTVGHKIEWD
jgi:hypothetical protein